MKSRSDMKSGSAMKSGKAGGGAKAEQVKAVQEALKDKGHDPGAVDGIMGPKTKQALRDYQKAEGLKATGNLDSETASKLGVQTTSAADSASPAASPSGSSSSGASAPSGSSSSGASTPSGSSSGGASGSSSTGAKTK